MPVSASMRYARCSTGCATWCEAAARGDTCAEGTEHGQHGRKAARLEKRSKERGKPSQVKGWMGGDRGSVVIPNDYMKLAGPWTGDTDPAPETAGG